jgi:hypothetical protein
MMMILKLQQQAARRQAGRQAVATHDHENDQGDDHCS